MRRGSHSGQERRPLTLTYWEKVRVYTLFYTQDQCKTRIFWVQKAHKRISSIGTKYIAPPHYSMGTITLIYYHRLLCWRLLAWLSEIAPNTRFKRRSFTPTPHPQILRLVNTLCCQSTKHRREITWKLQQFAIMKGKEIMECWPTPRVEFIDHQ